MKQYFCVGTYTEPILFGTGEVLEGKGEGIYLCCLDGGRLETLNVLPMVNPSFLCMDEERRKIYAVGETKEWQGEFGGSISEVSYDESGHLSLDSTYGTGGTDPCHVAVSPDRRWLAVANFASGALTAFPLDAQGGILPQRRLFQHRGRSLNEQRQKGPHAHSAIFSRSGLLFVPDLGKDEVVCYRCGEGGLLPEEGMNVRVTPGSGPRFGEFSADGRHFYLMNEISSSVMHFTCRNGEMTLKEQISALPAGFGGHSTCADLHLTPNGKFLYASNRGHDSLAIFRVNADGSLACLGHQPCGGHTPRNFAVDPTGRMILVGNQDSDSIAAFAIDADGWLTEIGNFPFPTPVCIMFFQNNLQ